MIKLNENEQRIKLVRKHWFVITLEGLLFVILAIIPPIISSFFGEFGGTENAVKFDSGLALFIYSIWLLFLWVGFFIAWTDYWLDIWLITNQRVIDIDQRGLFNRDIASIRL